MAISKLGSQRLNFQLMPDSSKLYIDSDLFITPRLTQPTPRNTEVHHGSTQGTTVGNSHPAGKGTRTCEAVVSNFLK